MAALTPTLVISYDAGAGRVKRKIFTATPQADGDTVDLSAYFSTIYAARAQITGGADANLCFADATFSGTTVTIAEKEEDYTAATDWTSGELTLDVTGLDVAL